jgi:hypothetical protein
MKPNQNRSGSSGAASALPHAFVPADQYTALAAAAVRANGGVGVIIRPAEKPAQWRAWIAYADHLGAGKGRFWRTLETLTVPTDWPLEFDLSAPGSSMVAPGEDFGRGRARQAQSMIRDVGNAKGFPETPRDRVIAGYRNLQAQISPDEADSRKAKTVDERSAAAAYHEQKLAALAESNVNNPVKVSTPSLAAYLAKDGVSQTKGGGYPDYDDDFVA